LQWIDIENKSSWVWKYCGVKTDGHAYCRYIINEDEKTECGWNYIYNSQTSKSESITEESSQEKETKKKAEDTEEETEELIVNAIYDALYNYFDFSPNSVLFASILDSRFKKMKGWPKEEKERTITLLRSEYTFFKKNNKLLNREFGNKNRYHFKKSKEKTINNFKSCLFEEEKEINDDNEIDYYFKFRILQANSDKDSFK
ncbi:30838_t:CDS:2, partial [Gigaspora margarita]